MAGVSGLLAGAILSPRASVTQRWLFVIVHLQAQHHVVVQPDAAILLDDEHGGGLHAALVATAPTPASTQSTPLPRMEKVATSGQVSSSCPVIPCPVLQAAKITRLRKQILALRMPPLLPNASHLAMQGGYLDLS